MSLNSWRIMWVLAIFDLPTQTKKERKAYSVFRKSLLKNGFLQMQYSVYIRNMPTFNKAQAMVSRLGPSTPQKGVCSFIFLTDKQYGLTKNFYGQKLANEKIPKKQEQLLLFGDF